MDAPYIHAEESQRKSLDSVHISVSNPSQSNRSNKGIRFSLALIQACYFERGSLRSQHALIEGQDRDAGAGSDRD